MMWLSALQCFFPAYAGMACLALSISRHRRQVGAGEPPLQTVHPQVLTMTGWTLLSVSLLSCLSAWGWGTGTVALLGLLSAGSLIITGLLTLSPGMLPGSIIAAAAGFLLAFVATAVTRLPGT